MSEPASTEPGLRLGAWVRADGLVGLVAAVDAGTVAVFDPGQRQLTRVPAGRARRVPAAAVTVTLTVDLPLAHGVAEATLRRWAASLTDDALRDRARAALLEADLDDAAALPPVRLDVTSAASSAAVCLCGARTPAPRGSAVACARCGREAVTPPRPPGDGAPAGGA